MLSEAIYSHLDELISDQYGNYVLQTLVEQNDNVTYLANFVEDRVQEFAVHQHASNVLEKCLEYCDKDIIQKLVGKTYENCKEGDTESAFSKMMMCRFGNHVVQAAYSKGTPLQKAQMLALIKSVEPKFKGVKYASYVYTFLDKLE